MYYPEELKLEVISKVQSNQITQAEAMRQYDIRGHSTILKWIKKYGYLQEEELTRSKEMKNKQEEQANRIRKLEKLLADKELELSDVKLKSKILEKIIDLAEQDMNIKIKKNIGQDQLDILKRKEK